MVTREEIINIYKYVLGRDPESEQAIYAHIQTTDVKELRRKFIASKEFSDNYANQVASKALSDFAPPLDWTELKVGSTVDSQSMSKLLSRIKSEWEDFGKVDPHWSVLTHDDYRVESIEANIDKFYASGDFVLRIIQGFCIRNKIDIKKFDCCLELGCGVGRITKHLATIFPKVVGVDISAAHLEICDVLLKKNRLENVKLYNLSEISILERLPSYDCFVSVIVLQHNPPPIIKKMLEIILDKLLPGGIAVFQVPVYKNGYTFDIESYLKSKPHMEMHVLPQREVLATIRRAECELIEIREDSFASGRSTNSISNTFFLKKH